MLDILDNPVIEFTAHDRCDRCGAQAYTMATKEGCSELLFCLHHRNEHYDALLDQDWKVIDDAAALENLYGSNRHINI